MLKNGNWQEAKECYTWGWETQNRGLIGLANALHHEYELIANVDPLQADLGKIAKDYCYHAAHSFQYSAQARIQGNEKGIQAWTRAGDFLLKATDACRLDDKRVRHCWQNAAFDASRAAEVITDALGDLWERYTRAASYYEKAAEAELAENRRLSARWRNAGESLDKSIEDSSSIEDSPDTPAEVREFYARAASYYEKAAKAELAENRRLSELWWGAGDSSVKAAKASPDTPEEVKEFYARAASYYEKAAKAELAENRKLSELWEGAGVYFVKAAEVSPDAPEELKNSYIQAAIKNAESAEEVLRLAHE